MLTFDYTITRDEGDEERIFVPQYPKTLPNLACIEGPNSSGKSTLLNLVALGCHGIGVKRMHASLTEKMRGLLEAKHQRVQFTIAISNEQGEVVLEMRKPSDEKKDIQVYETLSGKKQLLSPAEFHSRYTLIYDVPDNPIGRVKELARELGDEQNLLSNRLTQFRSFLHDTLDAIEHAYDPDRIDTLSKQVEGIRSEMEATKSASEALVREREWLEKYFRAKSFLEHEALSKQLNESRQALEKECRDEVRQKGHVNREVDHVESETKEIFGRIRAKLNELEPVLKQIFPKESRHFDSWGKGRWREELIAGDGVDELGVSLTHFVKLLIGLQKKTAKNTGMDEAKFLGKLLETLRNFQDFKLIVPGVNKEIKQFIAILEKKYSECQEYALLSANMARADRLLDEVANERGAYLAEVQPRLSKVKTAVKAARAAGDEAVGPNMRDRLAQFRARCQEEDLKFAHIRQECKKLRLPEDDMKHFVGSFEKTVREVKPYISHSEREREAALSAYQKQINQKDAELKLFDTRQRMLEAEIEQLRLKEPHPYQAETVRLKALFETAQNLEQSLQRRFSDYLSEVISDRIDQKAAGEKAAYFDQLWRYLGRRVRVVRHGESEYPVEKIDLATKVIHVVKGKRIHLNDMGTGQGQAAYLKGILNKQDKKRIIALIDEVAMMDSESLRPIRECLRKLNQDGRLLLGLIVQRGDAARVSPI